jgi:glycogen debranching enzyme
MNCFQEALPFDMDPSRRIPSLSRAHPATKVFLRAIPWILPVLAHSAFAQTADTLPQLSREARPEELISVPGQNSAILGHESGRFEAWAWPLKILHDFHISVRAGGQILTGDSLVRSITVRPESTTLVYAGDTFSIRETLAVPIDQSAALVRLQIETAEPIETIVTFAPDLQLEWPGAIGGVDTDWNPKLRAYVMSEPQERFEALVGSSAAGQYAESYPPGYTGPEESAFSLGITLKGTDTKYVVMTAASGYFREAEQHFLDMVQSTSTFDDVIHRAREYYENYLRDRVQVTLPDPMLQSAFEWAEISMIQSAVNNPYLGPGLIAGYNTSGDDERPGFAWFFGRDALWTTFALNSVGDFTTSRTAIDFLSRHQREDGKIPHEIAQTATFLPWFKSVPFAWAAADATPLFIIATRDYVQQSGDVQFARDHWDQLWKAYQFLGTTLSANGLAQNVGVGHGWVEAGPLVPIRSELYQSGLGLEAVHSLAQIAALLHKEDVHQQLVATFDCQLPALNRDFWIPDMRAWSLGLDMQGQVMNIPSVLSAVPMWFGLLDTNKTEAMIDRVAGPDFETDWGARIISANDPKYNPGEYHDGSVWPLFTGWASVGEYRYHRSLAGYTGLMANAQLTWAGSLGHVTEVLSGNYFQNLSLATPDQTWSSAMVAAPLLRGLFGLEAEATAQTLTFTPHVPAGWTAFAIKNVRVGTSRIDLSWSRTPAVIHLNVTRRGFDSCDLDFAPALSLRAEVRRVLLNGRPVQYNVEANSIDRHVRVRVHTSNVTQTVTIEVENDFAIGEENHLPPPGSPNLGARVTGERWSADRSVLTVDLAAPKEGKGELLAWNVAQIARIDGASLLPAKGDSALIQYRMPAADTTGDAHLEIAIHFRGESKKHGQQVRGRDIVGCGDGE